MASDAPAQVPTASSEPAPAPATAPAVTTPATESATPNATKPAPAPKGGAKDSKTPAADGEKKLSGAELKAKAKAEKLARRAQTKAAVTAAPSASPGGADAKGGKSKQKQDGPQATGGAKGQQGKQVVAPTPVVKDDKPAIPECYSHLSMAKRIKMTQADKDVHPAVLVLGQQMSAFTLDDSTSRLEAMLQALKKVIESYTTPQGTTFSRHFTSHVLNPQIEYLTACRPMCFSMGNAVRWLKLQVSKIDIDLPDFEAKKLLCESIDSFLHERIVLADLVIVKAAADLIFNGDAVLTYAHHPLVERAFQYARHEQKKDFTVLLVDDPFERIGKEFAKRLVADGIEVSYIPDLSAMRTHLQEASTVFVGAEAMFSNGAMYARAGTCDIAITAMDLGVQVAGLSETINFTERVAMDSLTYNEIDPERHSDAGFRLLFDTTQDKHLTVVITELGNTATTSVAAILRKLEEL